MSEKPSPTPATLSAWSLLRRGFAIPNDYRLIWLLGLFVMFPTLGVGVGARKMWVMSAALIPSAGFVAGALVLVLFALRFILSAGLIEAVAGYFQNRRLSFKEIFGRGLKWFVPMLLAHLLMWVALMALGLTLGGVRFVANQIIDLEGCFAGVFYVAMILVFAAVGLGLGVSFAFVQRYLVLDKQGAWSAWKKGAALFVQHRVLALRLGLAQILLVFASSVLMGVAFAVISRSPLIGMAGGILLLIAVNSFFGASFHSMYTVAFFELTRPEQLLAKFEKPAPQKPAPDPEPAPQGVPAKVEPVEPADGPEKG